MGLDPGLSQCDQDVVCNFFSFHFWSVFPNYLLHSQTEVQDGARAITLPYSYQPETKKVSLVPAIYKEVVLVFPEDAERLSDWVTQPCLNQSAVSALACRDGVFGPIRPAPGRGLNHTPTPALSTGKGNVLTGGQSRGDARNNQAMPTTPFPPFPISLSFSPSLLLFSLANSGPRVEATNVKTYSLPLRPFRAGQGVTSKSNAYSNR